MKLLLLLLALIVVIAIPLTLFMFYGMSDVRRLVIREVDLSKIADGTYAGSYHKGRFTYDVEVAVRDHRIVAIKNKNPRTRDLGEWNDRAEAAMVSKQSINVDVVSGATLNTKAFGKAVELALSGPARH
ncbi:MAG TPA: FMN-binding protein [Polyangiales bacterium]|nr:FMN-binding protein [Polyangiales bacterium]